MPQNQQGTTQFDNVRTLIMSGALDDLKRAVMAGADTDRLHHLATFERATAIVNWEKLERELREVIR